MKALVFVLLLALLGCAEIEKEHKIKGKRRNQEEQFRALQSGDKFDLAEFKYAHLDVSYSDSNTLQYRVAYGRWFYKVTINKKDSVILSTRNYWVK